MKILISTSSSFYPKIKLVKKFLEEKGLEVIAPSGYGENPPKYRTEKLTNKEFVKIKQTLYEEDDKKINETDALLVLNYDKPNQPNYVGGAVFREMVNTHNQKKKIYLLNPIPKGILYDEIKGFNPTILNKDLSKINSQNIEVEIRSFITKEKFQELLDFFKKNAELTKKDFQETHYFDCEQDLRIQKNNSGSKIWLKKGKLHDDAREEIEIKTDKENFQNLENLFKNLGHNIEIKWERLRHQFNWNEIKICLDYTKGYGYIIELEKMSNEQDKEKTLEELKQKLKELNIPLTPKEIFNEKYNYYKKNWQELIK